MVDGAASHEPAHLVLYDGTCGVCQRTVQRILADDRHGLFHFAPLQGPTAAALRARHPNLPRDLDSVLYVDRSDGTERVYVRAEAIARILDRLGIARVWRTLLRVLPEPLADAAYRLFARNRHRLSSALGSCELPPPAARARFLP